MTQETPEVHYTKTLDTALNLLYVYMLALAMAGVNRLPTAPKEEPLTSDSCDYVEVPLDVTTKYYLRAKKSVENRNAQEALNWLLKKHEEEVTCWIDVYRHSTKTLGCVIRDTMVAREARWEAPEARRESSPRGRRRAHLSPPPARTKYT